METPSSLLRDVLGLDSTFDDDGGGKAPTLDQSYPLFAESVVRRGPPFASSSKMKLPQGLGAWDDMATEEATEAPDTDMIQTQHMFSNPGGLFAQGDSNTMMELRDRSSKTPSMTAELTRSTRLSASRKTTSSTSSASAASLASAATDITVPDPEPPKKRARTYKKIKKEAPEDDKRNKFLERNRVAASKCREKKKEFVSKLEETKKALESKHAQLQLDYNALIAEVGGLKHSLMTHAKCNDPNIDRWISNEARKFVQTSDIFGHQRAAAAAAAADQGPPPPLENPFLDHTQHQQHQSLAHSRHSSTVSSLHPHGYANFTGPDERRGSMAYSQGGSFDYGRPRDGSEPPWTASSTQTSPTDMAFTIESPKFGRDMTGMNFDHMPDDMFEPEQEYQTPT